MNPTDLSNCTVWQEMIESFNFELGSDILPVDLPVPDYENLL